MLLGYAEACLPSVCWYGLVVYWQWRATVVFLCTDYGTVSDNKPEKKKLDGETEDRRGHGTLLCDVRY